jgi:hypothetical protein
VFDRRGLAVARHWHELRTAQAVQAAEQQPMEVARQYMLRHHDKYRLFLAYNSTVHTVMHHLSLPHPRPSPSHTQGLALILGSQFMQAVSAANR